MIDLVIWARATAVSPMAAVAERKARRRVVGVAQSRTEGFCERHRKHLAGAPEKGVNPFF
jgi:hypothetical protein